MPLRKIDLKTQTEYSYAWREDGIYILETNYQQILSANEVNKTPIRYNLYQVEGESLNLIKTTTRDYDPRTMMANYKEGIDTVVLFFRPDRICLLSFKNNGENSVIPILGEFEGPDVELPEIAAPIIEFSLAPDHSSILIFGDNDPKGTEIISINESGIKREHLPFNFWYWDLSIDNKYLVYSSGIEYAILDCQTLEYQDQEVNSSIIDVGFTLDNQYVFYIGDDHYLNLYTKELDLIERLELTNECMLILSKFIDDVDITYNHQKKELIIRPLELIHPPSDIKKYTIYYVNLTDQTIDKREIEEIEIKAGVHYDRITYRGNDFLTLCHNCNTKEKKLYIYQEPGKRTKAARK